MTTSPLPPPSLSFSPEHRNSSSSLPRQRLRCASCSDTSFSAALDESSFLLDIRPRHFRTPSICEQIQDETYTGTIVYFCRSRGHGFIRPERGSGGSRRPSMEFSCGHNNNLNNNNTQESEQDHFLHISDIDSDYVPRKGDKVTYSLCPIPPKFEKFQAVNVRITSMSPLPHARWDAPQTVEDMDGKEEEEEDRQLPPPGDI